MPSVSKSTRLPLISTDLTAVLLDQLREAVPQVFSEGHVDFVKLQAALGAHLDDNAERYGLNWAGKREAFRNVQNPSRGTLRPQRDESVNWDTTENLIIEGDNLKVLKLLQKAYHAQVKLIYIDPPYNTGNEFIYPDNFYEEKDDYLRATGQLSDENTATTTNKETNGRYHSNWLNMMYPRLFLARNLMKEDGVILVSIDDHEVNNLRLLMDEVFGEENFVACMVWEKGRKNDAKLISVGHEYLLVYARSQQFLREKNTVWREEKPGARDIWDKYTALRAAHGPDDAAIEQGMSAWYSALPRSHPAKKWSRYKRVDEHGPWRDRDISWPGGNGPRYDVIHPITGLPCAVPERGWIYAKPEEMERQIQAGLVVFRDDHTQPPFRKAHIRPVAAELLAEEATGSDDETNDATDDDDLTEGFATQVRGSYFYKQSQVAVKALRKLLGGKLFDNPKDHEELAKLFQYVMGSDTTGLVLDFFGGSGTTAEAVLRLNQEDGGTRRFLLVQLDEATSHTKYPTIAHITRERVRRVGAVLQNNDASKLALYPQPPTDLGFRAFHYDTSNFKLWQPDEAAGSDSANLAKQLSLYADHLMPDRSEDDVRYELMLKTGLPLSSTMQGFKAAGLPAVAVADGSVVICLAPHLTREALRELFAPAPKTGRPAPRLVLCLDASFDGNDALKTNAVLEAQTAGVTFKTV
ncbi:site-specific DNA-methyltransferase [Hymenobacter sp. H14-R3]|uniref:site-specific DNA-methyltransferase n=1 Tax=Hymenobacter sp. H14-R3 TaxID=3046308 RepID=UPI0024BBB5BE|nr:site-specific DNA-methyltransferase [Hymenobacter sp. H14-R3]MDJ0367343.1 site-specific DNA-methyltransferase [Hymenobacter sp. H14-R3]